MNSLKRTKKCGLRSNFMVSGSGRSRSYNLKPPRSTVRNHVRWSNLTGCIPLAFIMQWTVEPRNTTQGRKSNIENLVQFQADSAAVREGKVRSQVARGYRSQRHEECPGWESGGGARTFLQRHEECSGGLHWPSSGGEVPGGGEGDPGRAVVALSLGLPQQADVLVGRSAGTLRSAAVLRQLQLQRDLLASAQLHPRFWKPHNCL